ncbi:MAG TPA: hypothetical protein VD862_03290 [Candidatus Paceibacterota bacterium]|nr:hypothetical protein [Candidatus Paceibacterota bacterium]
MRRLLIGLLLAVAVSWAMPADAGDGARRRHPRPDGRSYRAQRHFRPYVRPYHGPNRQYRPYYRYGGYGYRFGYGYYRPVCTAWVNGYLAYDAWGRPVYVPGYPVAVPCPY